MYATANSQTVKKNAVWSPQPFADEDSALAIDDTQVNGEMDNSNNTSKNLVAGTRLNFNSLLSPRAQEMEADNTRKGEPFEFYENY